MATMYLVTRPEMVIDPNLPISMWDYADRGAGRLEKIMRKIWIKSVEAIYSGSDPRTVKAAQMLADQLGYRLHPLEEFSDVTRPSADVSPERVKEFYAHPDQNVQGWEKAIDVQKRARAGIDKIFTLTPKAQYVAIVSQTIIANLLMCTIREIPIAQLPDLPATFSFEAEAGGKPRNWKSLDLL